MQGLSMVIQGRLFYCVPSVFWQGFVIGHNGLVIHDKGHPKKGCTVYVQTDLATKVLV